MPKLTQRLVDGLEPDSKPYEQVDSGTGSVPGFRVRVEPSGTKTFYLRQRLDGRPVTHKIGRVGEIPLVRARELAESIRSQGREYRHGRADNPALQNKFQGTPSIREFIEAVYAPHAAPRRKRWPESQKRIVHCFGQLLDWPLDDPRLPHAFKQYQDKALARGLAASSVNNDLSVMGAVFTYAVKHDFLDKHPMKKIERLKVDNARIRYLGSVDPDEPRRFWQALEDREERIRIERDSANKWRAERGYKLLPDLRKVQYADHLLPICIVAADSGLRQGEIFQLEWRDVDFYADVLRVRAEVAKSSKARAVPMTQRVRKCLEDWRAQTVPGGIVFKGKEGNPITDIKSAWRNLMKEAEIEGFRFHDLRHDFASRLAMRGVPLFQISRLLGHSDTRTSEKYSHLSPAVERAAIDALETEIPSRIVAFPTPSNKDAGINEKT